MTRGGRIGLFAVGGVVLGIVLVWGLTGLPAFGDYPGPYGDIVSQLVTKQRHMTNAVTAVVFDYRGFDTLGEELLMFSAACATALLLRETRDFHTEAIVDRIRSDAVNAAGVLGGVATFLLALYVIAHGLLTPGGGFQGGVVLAAAFVFVFLGIEYHGYARIATTTYSEPVESFGAGAYVGLGLLAFAFGDAFMQNFVDLGVTGRLRSGGSAAIVNWASALAVAGGFLVIFTEYLEENMAVRHGRKAG
jgi:multicomponent Na+:H+ antiporter subunit B